MLVQAAGAHPPRLVARSYGPDNCDEVVVDGVSDLAALRDPDRCLWLEVTGLGDTGAIAAIGQAFGLHALSLEDALDPAERPKVEQHDDHTFAVIRALTMTSRVESHQLSIFFGEGFVVTLQDVEHDVLEPVRGRLRQGRGKIRHHGADYLAYALIDTVIDHYFPVIEAFDDHLERVEDAVLEARSHDPLEQARRARQDLQTIRHAVGPARDLVVSLLREDAARVTDETRIHLRDCYDHLVQLQDMVETSREIAASLLDAYISRVSQRTNEVMRVLTLVATIFIPLTFLTGVYGMNFNTARSPYNMPELDWYWGYPASLLVMAAIVVGSLVYFRRKGWLGSPR